jgi:hypothetical protein
MELLFLPIASRLACSKAEGRMETGKKHHITLNKGRDPGAGTTRVGFLIGTVLRRSIKLDARSSANMRMR